MLCLADGIYIYKEVTHFTRLRIYSQNMRNCVANRVLFRTSKITKESY